MAKHRKEHALRLLAIVASIALVVGLLPASAFGADGEPAGRAPEAPAAALAGEGAAQPGTSPVPEKGKVRSQDAGEAAPDAAAAAKIMYDGCEASVIKEKTAEYDALQNNVPSAAARGYVDAVIAPAETRKYLIGALDMLFTKREYRPDKKHGTV